MKNHPVQFMRLFCGSVMVVLMLAGCSKQSINEPVTATSPSGALIPKSPGTIIVPADNPMTAAKIDLGRHLFFDKQLSVDGSTSCATCHDPSGGFSDIRILNGSMASTSMGFSNRMGTRNAPSLANIAYNSIFTWDGRFKSLEAHAQGPIFNSLEMGNNFSNGRDAAADTVSSGYHSDPGGNDTLFLFKRLNNQTDMAGKTMPQLFTAAYGSGSITMWKIANAIACFERTFISTQSTFDRFNNGDESAYKYNPQALHGYELFTDTKKANCISCHSGYNFTDQQFHNNGIGAGVVHDSGRMNITKNSADLFKFKTPSLRNVAVSAPYMHDGRFATLEKVLGNYNVGGTDSHSANLDSKIQPLNLSKDDIADIIAFLTTLNDDKFTVNPQFTNPWGK
jgi:cytochrome c peroxidase